MTWTFTIEPTIPGLTIESDGLNSAILHGSPLQPFSGVVLVSATDGATIITSALELHLYPFEKTLIAEIDNRSNLLTTVGFISKDLQVSVLDTHIIFETIPTIVSTAPLTTTFTSNPI